MANDDFSCRGLSRLYPCAVSRPSAAQRSHYLYRRPGLAEDIRETNNVAAAHPAVVQRLTQLADSARQELGDALTGQVGSAVREPGRVTVSGQ